DMSRAYRFDPERVERLVGMAIPEAEQVASLTALGFRVEGGMAHVPSWRPDVLGEADIVEEVARIASLTKLKGQPMRRTSSGVPKPILTPLQRREQAARRTCAGLGLNECVTYTFIDAEASALFGGAGEDTRLENPISSEMSHMRPALLPGLLRAASRNQARGFADLALFEIGAAFHGGEPGEQHLLATGLRVGRTGPKDVHGADRPVDLFDAKADAEAVLAAIGAPAKAQIRRGAREWWHPGRHGMVSLGPKNVLAIYGELHPRVLDALDVKGPAVGFTVWLANPPYPKAKGAARSAMDISDLQAVERDFAFVLDADVAALDVVNAAQGADKALIDAVRVFDEFVPGADGGALGAGKKSLAITVRLQPRDKTLTDEEIDAVGRAVVAKVEKATGGTLRG
ncbi:MAG: phenylalanine--tRNA ligase subunit beta, partial [Pseudomonadota bacterium]